ncbi:hypothetical protein [Mycobacterium conspicuum]|jgi:hypothetical protein|uniref:Uncharacterized protein n=1 Tax=Mycobacterium conspicuum TaxID=44010 RepID=A0A1X1SSD2_9MYCO|nr:hypothetical protein [Mycobacterium conspicuum]ORV33426.1 hypothetical protein AWC00_27725 [Mycobacterium conspicuum]BBZ39475.1 hypothetical protein MCNS_25380 [Mycobacterium conspicuum]
MQNSDEALPDDVPVADAVEQQRPVADLASDDDYPSSRQPDGDVPLEAAAPDWHEQQEPIPIDPEFEEPDP